MFNKVYEKVKKYLKENYKFILFEIFIVLILVMPLPYYVNTTGGIIDVTKYIDVENKTKSKGSFNLAYVTSYRATIPTYLLSYILPGWDIENIDSYTYSEKESASDVANRGKLSLTSANNAAIEVAYTKADKEYSITNSYYNIIYIADEAETSLQVGDILLEYDGYKLEDIEQYTNYISSKKEGDKINLKVLRKNKKVDAYAKVKIIDNQKLVGISIYKTFDYKTDPKISIHFTSSEEGPSGGFMTALAIYDMLIEKDLTHGLTIVGTGTIDNEGNVGEIDGVSYKLKGAVRKKADIFFAPTGSNYEEAKKIQKKYNYKIKIIEVKTIDDAIEYLENLD